MSEYDLMVRLFGNVTGAFIAVILMFISLANFLVDRRIIRILEITIFTLLTAIYATWTLNSVPDPIITMAKAARINLYLWVSELTIVVMWLFAYARQKIEKIALGGTSFIVVVNHAYKETDMQKIELPGSIKIPGAFWVIFLVVSVALAHHYLTDPFLVDLFFVVVGLVAPMLIENNADLKRAMVALQLLTGRTIVDVPREGESINPGPILRGLEQTFAENAQDTMGIEQPRMPGPVKTYFFG